MIALAALVNLPRLWIVAIGAAIVLGHDLLDPVTVPPGKPGHALWAVLHDRGHIDLWEGVRARTSYPLLPWIGVIALGYAAGPWFGAATGAARRRRNLLIAGVAMLVAFVLLRSLAPYGEPSPSMSGPTPLFTLMSFLNLTKYPPSLDFLLLTLGVGALLLAVWQELPAGPLAAFGGAPLFFYLLHLYALHLLHLLVAWLLDRDGFDVPSIAWVWAIAAALAPPLWWATRWFADVKRRNGRWWIRYL